MKKIHDPRFPYLTIVPIFDNLWALKELSSTNFLIKGTEKALLVDTAYGLTDYRALTKELIGDLPLLVVNSHAHPDHNAGNNQFGEVMVGRGDEADDCHEVTPEDKAGILDFMQDLLKPYPAFDPDAYHPGLSEKVRPLDEGDVIDLGDLKLEVIEIPGHTVGSIALYEKRKGWIFTGDTVLTWEVWGQLENSAPLHVYAESLEKLAALAPRLNHVFPAHGVPEAPMGEFMLPPEILTIYARGTRAILEGKLRAEAYQNSSDHLENIMVARFEVGGMVFRPNNM